MRYYAPAGTRAPPWATYRRRGYTCLDSGRLISPHSLLLTSEFMPIFLYFGDNQLEMGEAVRTLRTSFNPADIITLEGTTVPLPTLAQSCLTAGLFDPERLVIVESLHERFKGQKKEIPEDLMQILGSLAPTTTLLLVSPDMGQDHPLVFAVRSLGGKVQTFSAPKKGNLAGWIAARGDNHGVAVDPAAAELLAELIGPNVLMLENELEKLATYAGNGPRITAEMVDTMVGAITQEAIFALIDAVASGNRARAFALLRAQLEAGNNTPMEVALYLIRMLARQMRILLRIRLAQEAGRSKSQIVTDLKLPRYFADRYFSQARRLSQVRLVSSFERLASLEQKLKTGKADPGTGLDLLVTELCA